MNDALGLAIGNVCVVKYIADYCYLQSALLAALPHAVMAIVVLIGGQLADRLRSTGKVSTTNVRKLFNCGGFSGETLFLFALAFTRDANIAVPCLILSVGFSGFAISGLS
jgi:ACS family sodium-dependent inorganic phosphate cotransporter-like MFS transporter 6/7/8